MNNISFVFNSMIWKYGKVPIIIVSIFVILIIIICFILASKEVKKNKDK